MIKEIEQLIANKLASLEDAEKKKLFKTADRWQFQTGAKAGGKDAFERYSPFAFVKYLSTDTDRAGSLDLLRTLNFAVAIGVHGPDARSQVCDLVDAVLAAIDRKHPLELYVGDEDETPTAIACDILLAGDVDEVLENENNYAMQIIFGAKMVN